ADRVEAAASGLAASGVAPGDRVGLLLPNSVDFLVMALACLWVGAAFVPVSVEDPPARARRVVADCRPALVIGPGAPARAAPAIALATTLGQSPVAAPTVGTATVETVLGRAGPSPAIAEDPQRDAYLIYTSGTTGAPKGVRVPERALRAAVVACRDAVGFGPSVRALCPSPFHFDGAYGTLLPPLVAGGFVFIPNREELLFLKRFFSAVLVEGINHSGCSPSYLRMLRSSPQFRALSSSRLATFGLGGEECDATDVAALWDVLPGLRVFNRYGPTETTIEVTTYEVAPEDVERGRIPLGRPHPGTIFAVLGEEGTPVGTPGEVGELYIAGEQVMRGYWGDEELTASTLSSDVVAGQVAYRTGDLVWEDDKGRFFYAGRCDEVVKRNGVRVSLVEIELALHRLRGVSGAACALSEDEGRSRIAAFAQAAPGTSVAELFGELGGYLPKSMFPDEIYVVPSLPVTSRGKVDRRRLLAEAGLAVGAPRQGGERVSPGAGSPQ
ncbi:MAG TPA: AMP-binding protein, partial [Acidimicrobiales bacterium]|nr:AMP-binding protein [Acidimicrobiales bacterium]